MLKSASEFLKDSGRKDPVKMIDKSFLSECRIFSVTVVMVYRCLIFHTFSQFFYTIQKVSCLYDCVRPVGYNYPVSPPLAHNLPNLFSGNKKMKTKLFILQIKILIPIIVRDILTINCTSGYHSKTWCRMLYIYFEKLIFILHILWHAGPDPGENIRDSWRPKLEAVSADLFLINRLSWNGKSKRPFSSSPDCPGIELVNCSSRSNKQNHSDSSYESAYKNLKLKNLSLLNNESSFLHRTKAIQNSIFAKK